MTLRVRNVQVDVAAGDHDAAVAFWAAALGATTRPGDGAFTHLVGPAGRVGLHVQRLEEGPARYHLDLEGDDPAGELARARSLGASVPAGASATTLEDPAGMPFCIRPAGEVVEELGDAGPGRSRLHLLVLDVPSEDVAATVAFWSGLLDAEARPAGAGHTTYTTLAGASGPTGRLGLLVQDIGPGAPARIHLDLHVDAPADRDAEVDRFVQLGAERVGQHQHWVTLAAPGGHLLCVVPDRKDDE